MAHGQMDRPWPVRRRPACRRGAKYGVRLAIRELAARCRYPLRRLGAIHHQFLRHFSHQNGAGRALNLTLRVCGTWHAKQRKSPLRSSTCLQWHKFGPASVSRARNVCPREAISRNPPMGEVCSSSQVCWISWSRCHAVQVTSSELNAYSDCLPRLTGIHTASERRALLSTEYDAEISRRSHTAGGDTL